MKIIRNNICYIELDDINFFENLPPNILIELKMGYSREYRFQRFIQKEAVNFFAKNPCIIDYDLICELSIEQLDIKIEQIRQILNKICLNWLDSSEKNINNGYFNINNFKYILKTLEKYRNNKSYYDAQINKIFNCKQKRL